MIIGLVGRMASGKGEFVNIMTNFGFNHITLSSMIREEAKKQNREETRENLMEIGNGIRSAGGAGALMKKAVEKLKEKPTEDWIIDGIRNPAEISELIEYGDVFIVGLYAEEDILVNRILSRKRAGDAVSREDIVAKLDREYGKDEPEEGQQVEKCMQQVEFVIRNEGSLDEFTENVMEFYNGVIE